MTSSIKKLKNVAKVTVSSVDKHIYDYEIPVIACHYTDVYYNETLTEQQEYRAGSVTLQEKEKFFLAGGEVLITKDSETPDDIAIPAYVESCKPDTVCGYHLAIIRPHKNTHGRYLFWTIKSKPSRDYFSLAAQGVTRYGLPLYRLKDFRLPFPDLPTQRAIADFLDRETARLDTVKAKTTQSIDRLKEFRAALITATVTGQIDVTTWKRRGTTDARLDAIEAEMSGKEVAV